MMYEVELKFEALDSSLLDDFLSDGVRSKVKRTVDVYLDDKQANFFKRGIFIRIRDNKTLEFKYNPKDFKHEFVVERNFELPLRKDKIQAFNQLLTVLGMKHLPPDQFNLKSFLELNDLHEFVVIDKRRTVIIKEPFKFNLDEVKNLGLFVEIECHTDDEAKIPALITDIKTLAKKLKLKLLNTGYVELYLRKYNYELYKQGLYILEIDKS